ncbi:MAG: xanthine dehydrogenase family protein subunit M [Verrucomicrobiaceae bacterium]|nr:MAG: xanthine dehydrogenase family protein subunit M [Verrucomicrobiaceae bacterium]
MKLFEYHRAASTTDAVKLLADRPEGRYLAGGTNLLDLMKDDIQHASDIVDLTRAGMDEIRESDGGLMLGALVTNTDAANHPVVRGNYPLLTRAILAGATMQIRNMATTAGNILQRTRCPYFYDHATPCNKREPGTACSAIGGLNRTHAIFGASDQCVAVHPSDMAVALSALEATVHVLGPDGATRTIPFEDFHRLPGNEPETDNTLRRGELIVGVHLPPAKFQKNVYYLKVRDRTSYAFALVSVAAALHIEDGIVKEARIAMGGVAHKPWRLRSAEEMITGKPFSRDQSEKAARAALSDAKPLEHNGYKLPLAESAIIRALSKAAAFI